MSVAEIEFYTWGGQGYFKFKFIYLQRQCTLINITVNVPELAQRAILHL